jgi:transglutaminase-like putative cysteine protease
LLVGTVLPKDPLALGRVFYDRVDEHVTYDKSRPGYGNGDAVWVCDSRFGNCTDFHSLFIAWARAHGLPARFEIGFPLPDQRGSSEITGYHCWAFFYLDGHGWTPVDISEADKFPAMKDYYFGHLTENRVTFTVGRDINLVPRQAAQPLNFFVYPYAEIKGQPVPKDQIKLTVRFEDEQP